MPRALPPVVFVPGLPGSALIHRQDDRRIFFRARESDNSRWKKQFLPALQGPDDPAAEDAVVAGEPIATLFRAREPLLDVAPGKQAASLYDLLRHWGYREQDDRLRPVGWDWRLPVDHPTTLDRLRRALVDLHAEQGARVVVLAHGAGGLVVRALLEAEPELCERLALLVTFGVPWAGCLEPLRHLTAKAAFPPFDRKETRAIFGHSWALWEMLPPAPDGADLADDEGPLDLFSAAGAPASPLTANSWIGKSKAEEPLRRRARQAAARLSRSRRELALGGRRLAVWNLAGWGIPTVVAARLGDEGELELEEGPDGDGVVPRRAAAWLAGEGVVHWWLPLGGFTPAAHPILWRGRAARELLRRALTGEGAPHHVHAAVDPQDVEGDPPEIRIRFVAQGEGGEPLAGAAVHLFDRSDPRPFGGDGRLTLAVHRERWQSARRDVRQLRIRITWTDGDRERRKDLTVLAGGRK